MSATGHRDEQASQPFGRRASAAAPAGDQLTAPGSIELLSRPGDACLRPRGALDEPMARRLEREAVKLIDSGVRRIVIDLRAVDSLTPSTSSLLWAVQRYGRPRGSSLSVVVGDTPVARAMDRAGLIAGLTDSETRGQPFFDWSR